MALPPKSDDATPAAADDGKKKSRLTRSRPRKTTAKAEKPDQPDQAEKAEKAEKRPRAAKAAAARESESAAPSGEARESAPAPRAERESPRARQEEFSLRHEEPASPPPAPREAAPREASNQPEARAEGREPSAPVESRQENREHGQPREPREQRAPRAQPEQRDERNDSQGEQRGGSRDESRNEPSAQPSGDAQGSSSAPSASSSPSSESQPGGGQSDGTSDRGAQSPGGGNQPAPGGQNHGGGDRPQHQHGGGGGNRADRGDWQGGGGGGGHQQHQHGGGGGGGGNDRNFWKQGKRKRGRHGDRGGPGGGGGHWQPGGVGGGGGGGREQHPPQPPPPSNAPVFGDLPNPSRFADLAALDTLATELSTSTEETLWLNEIYAMTLAEITAFARKLGVAFEGAPTKRQLLGEIFKFIAANKRTLRDRGFIDVTDRGAFVVHEHVNYRLYPDDAFLPESLIKRYGLKRGHRIEVTLQPPQEGERCPSVVRVDTVMGGDPAAIANVTPFEELVPYYPLKRILLESDEVQKDVSMRAVDILTPIGFGQRGLIVAPPRTGKTVLLQNIANSITANSPEVKLILLLIDERPEEVTDFKRHTKGEVVSSTFDETPESHVHCAEMVIENARRRVEQGEHVVILLDSITRLARAYNALAGNGGKTMSGGLESNALQKPKRFFGSARNIEGGGSLTIIASALIDTGSRMDEIIFEEFKGTGNSELHLDRGLVERRIFPAINIDRSGTRKEELIYHPDELQRIYGLRRAMQGLGPIESMEMLITRLKKTKSNAEFLLALAPK